MNSCYLGKVSPKILKRLKELKPKAPSSTPSGDIIPLGLQPEFTVREQRVSSPGWLACGHACPHKDWDSYFLTVSVMGRRAFGECRNGNSVQYLTIEPGDVFVVDGSVLHWLQGADNRNPRGWWIGLQWELEHSWGDCGDAASAILDMLEVVRNFPQSVDSRYKSWLRLD
jgi:hypothetical protein